ncbi:hypothetical protein MSG28_011629 [Choristoneura fumiferana]|uniref:Uncharacterized protein n=1 Tax=Choristoneura fumiferana TaxID=7141 RepID=A0ACC0KLQ4_CHOFU|nr:hypothetical protein MSG28_011629 [Choristoneura fumiferana]
MKVKSAIAELEPKIQETEKQFSSLEGGSGAAAARAARVRGKLRQEWAALKDNYTQRHEKRWIMDDWGAGERGLESSDSVRLSPAKRSGCSSPTPWRLLRGGGRGLQGWSGCQRVWAGLYAALEGLGAWLDQAERQLAAPPPQRDQHLRDLEQQVTTSLITDPVEIHQSKNVHC